jgi:hypothetical protein
MGPWHSRRTRQLHSSSWRSCGGFRKATVALSVRCSWLRLTQVYQVRGWHLARDEAPGGCAPDACNVIAAHEWLPCCRSTLLLPTSRRLRAVPHADLLLQYYSAKLQQLASELAPVEQLLDGGAQVGAAAGDAQPGSAGDGLSWAAVAMVGVPELVAMRGEHVVPGR